MRTRKGQAAVEYLVTYGWVFIVVLAAIAALSYFGLLSPQQYLPEKCDFGVQMSCVDQYLDVDGDVILRFKNLYDANITLTDATIINATGGVHSIFVSGSTIPRSEIGRLTMNAAGYGAFTEGKKERMTITVTFNRQGGSNSHTVVGSLLGEVSESLE